MSLGVVDCDWFGASPLSEEGCQLRGAVGSVFAEIDDVLRVKKGSVAFEHEEVRNSEDVGIRGQGLVTDAAGAVMDGDRDEPGVAKLGQFGVFLEELVHLVAEGTPRAADVEDDALPSALCLGDGCTDVLGGVSGGVELVYWGIARYRAGGDGRYGCRAAWLGEAGRRCHQDEQDGLDVRCHGG